MKLIKKNKKIYPNNSEDTQIRKTLEQMRKNGEIIGSVEIEAICNILNCDIIRINEDFDIANRERFEPDSVIANNEVKLYYQAGHYQYFQMLLIKYQQKGMKKKLQK
ncbi:OTU domain-containing protein [Spiroplasma endosymbiont of Amphimallon solstitiale]|uniref:OTU domain-containing protein n=1 Tax=Spiroplasma endosymbiont of Amphimallon solstitiale TaxID=3066288 RepID=UPI00313BF3E0